MQYMTRKVLRVQTSAKAARAFANIRKEVHVS